ncbi:MAG TPA: twin-arginine translocase TatA/TatE family subunit [Candidatus Saccharimonadales bacterium]|nr:twin-arginine translocase TatA/TatE family subunit [Candidatus Saccharimonadales bacterium]
MGRIGWQELLFLGMILMLLFGATKLPAIGRGLGEGIREFRKSLKGGDDSGSTPEPGKDQPEKSESKSH